MTFKIQTFGRFLSRMVMPNIGAFIAWGIITTLFHENGWIPNASIAVLIKPMIYYALPLLIAYTGGKAIDNSRGGMVAVVATMGLISGSDVPMFLGAMLMGPISGWLVKTIDRYLKYRIPSGFEMLSTNFSAGILGAVLAVISLKAVGPIFDGLTYMIQIGVERVVASNILFLSSLFIEPGKILFLNNAMNHGILGPLGIMEVLNHGKSVFFLLETNPGPGLGILIAYWLRGKGNTKRSTPAAMIIHALGGIHEIYFPYVLMNPALFIAVILGGMSGTLIFEILEVGLVATPSPGSLFAILALTNKYDIFSVVLGIVVSTLVTTLVAGFILKNKKDWQLDEEDNPLQDYKGDYKVRKIYFACDAGMGSSAMGSSILSKLAREHGMEIPVENISIDDLQVDADVVITYHNLLNRAKRKAPKALHIGIKDFMDKKEFVDLIELMRTKFEIIKEVVPVSKPNEILLKSNILLNRPSVTMEEAIIHAGELLFKSGYVEEGYIKGMLARERKFSTFIGNGVAIPHGENDVKDLIKASGIVVVQYPDGISFGENKLAKIVIGIAGMGNEHIQILANIAEAIEEESVLEEMVKTQSVDVIYNLFSNSEGTDI